MLLSEMKQRIEQNTYIMWQQRWQQSNSLLRSIQLAVKFELNVPLNRYDEKIYHRLRLGILGLNYDLYRLGLHENGLCNYCSEMETVSHLLLRCPIYIIERAMLMVEANVKDLDQIVPLLKSPRPDVQRALVRFIYRTRRLM